MDDFLKSYMASGRGQSTKDYLKTYEEKQKNKELYEQGKATRVITDYSTRKVGPDGSTKVPIYAYIPNQQTQAAPAPAPAPPAPAAPAPLMPQISAASQQYRAETQALSDKIAKQQADFNASQAAATKAREIAEQARITGIRTAASNQARSGQAPNLQIQPASKTEAKGGTSLFKKRSQDQFMTGISGMVNI